MRKKQKIINLYQDGEIASIRQIVSIGNEEDLHAFWEHIMTLYGRDLCGLYPFFVGLYELASLFLQRYPEEFFEIVLEQSDRYYYCTVRNRFFVRFARTRWTKRRLKYRHDTKRLTVKLSKTALSEREMQQENKNSARIGRLLGTVTEGVSTSSLPPYTFITQQDLRELFELAEDVDHLLCEAQESGISLEMLIRIRSYFSSLTIVLTHYDEVETVAVIMSEFSMMLNRHKEGVIALNAFQIAMLEGFVHNFTRWLKVLFVEGGAALDFMDRSLRADIEMIRRVFEPPEPTIDEGLDAIFDF